MNSLALFIAGFAAGLAAYRWYLQIAFGDAHFTMCDLCRYRQKKAADERRRED